MLASSCGAAAPLSPATTTPANTKPNSTLTIPRIPAPPHGSRGKPTSAQDGVGGVQPGNHGAAMGQRAHLLARGVGDRVDPRAWWLCAHGRGHRRAVAGPATPLPA